MRAGALPNLANSHDRKPLALRDPEASAFRIGEDEIVRYAYCRARIGCRLAVEIVGSEVNPLRFALETHGRGARVRRRTQRAVSVSLQQALVTPSPRTSSPEPTREHRERSEPEDDR